ncbi:hypothetical protein SPF06_07920 [Sinomonas sp. JGH33]|uniref:DUF1453 domain-containing protein n=1 Tax=Sinomonas terricola TaxID=3110330 RepID=A0ABU5T4W8_9MICC|nr:hypothetical protein [Sinomonas sp. JGH33]MEA5454643.1 hypothetical protein [Sinomonas sp. JGH33]
MNLTSSLSYANVVLAVGVLAWAVVRQFQTRPVGPLKVGVFLILGAIGVWQLAQLADSRGIAPAEALALALSLGLAAGFGWLRGRAAAVWIQDGVAYRRGGWPAVGLWMAAIGTHVAVDVLGSALDGVRGPSPVSSASIMLYIAVTLGIQSGVVARRAAALAGASMPVRESVA